MCHYIYYFCADYGISNRNISGIYSLDVVSFTDLLSFLFDRLYSGGNDSVRNDLLTMLYLITANILSVIVYFVLNKFFLWYKGLTLSNYRDINQMGKESITTYIQRAVIAYRRFFSTSGINAYTSMFPFRVRHIYAVVLLLCLCLLIYKIVKIYKQNKFRALLLGVCILIFPLAMNFIFVMCAEEYVHNLMLYGQTAIYLLLAFLLDKTEFSLEKLTQAVYFVGIFIFLFTSFSYSRYANMNYLKIEFNQKRAISYFTTLVTQIKNCDGYTDEMPVVYINPREIHDKTLKELSGFTSFYVIPYKLTTNIINSNSLFAFINNWCGFSPEYAEEEDFKDLPEVQEMPYYPDDGSIKIINDTIVVKFGPVEEEN